MEDRMSNENEAIDESRNDTTDSSDDDTFGTNLEDVNSDDRTFRSILSLLIGRQSVSQTLRLLRSEVGGDDSTSSSDSDEDTVGHYWHFHPRPSPATHHPPDTEILKTSEIYNITRSSVTNHCRRRSTKSSILQTISHGQMFGGLTRAETRTVLTNPRYLPSNGEQVAQYNKKVFCGTHARDGDLFITACPDKIRLYDTRQERFKLIQEIEPRDVGWSVLDVGISQDGRQLVYSSWSDSLHFVAIGDDPEDEAGSQHYNLQLHPGDHQFCIFSVSFSSDSKEILGGANDGCLYVYDREVNKQTSRIQAHRDDVNAVSFVDDTTHLLASGGDDGLVMVWDRRTLRQDDPRPVGVLAGHADGVTYIDPRMDGRHLISNSKDQSIKLWDIRRFSSPAAIEQSRVVIADQKWDYRWQRVPRNMTKVKTKVEGDSSIMTYTGHTILQTLIRCHFSPVHTTGQSLIYTGCAAGRVLVYDLLTGDIVKILTGHKGCVRDVSWHPYNQEILSSSWDFTVKKWSGVEKVLEEGERSSRLKVKEKDEDQSSGERRKDKKRRVDVEDQ